MDSVIVRHATMDDAAEIANVHINSWRESYKGHMPQQFLDDLPLSFKDRYQLWKRVTTDPAQITLVAECSENGVVGMVNGGSSRDPEFSEYAEVYCLYLLQQYHGRQIGLRLLKVMFELLSSRGAGKAYLWVLENNLAALFYEKTGGKRTGEIKQGMVAGVSIQESCYVWTELDLERK